MMTEELSRCPKCRKYESFLFTFEDCVSYVHCECKKPKQERINGKLPLDIAFEKVDQWLEKKKKEAKRLVLNHSQLTKKDLIDLYLNMREEKDILYDLKETLATELDTIPTYENEYHELSEIKDLLNELSIAKERYSFGVEACKEEIEILTDKLLTYKE